MRTLACILLLIAVPVGLTAQVESDIASPQKRMAVLDLVRRLLTTKPVEGGAAEIAQNNPFIPKQPATESQESSVSPVPVTGLGDHDLLTTIAANIAPSGTIKLGDTQILLFGQKKLKVGDSIPIIFQGTTYELQITNIERTSYTLRLNKEEITRPIKSSK